jgi:hypothetical protein
VSDLWGGKVETDSEPPDPPAGEELWAGRSERRPSRLGPGRRTRTVARVLLVVVLIGGPLMLGWVGLDLLAVRESLRDAQIALGDLRRSVGEVDVERSRIHHAVAEMELEDARRRAERPTWTIAATVPIVGPTVGVTRDVVEVAVAATDLAGRVLEDGEEFVGEGVEIEIVEGQADLEPLLASRDLLSSLPLERLVEARASLGTPREGWLPRQVVDGRDDVLTLADDTIGTIERARALTEALPAFLGADGPRSYFVGLQTSAELRGAGGMIGFWGVLSVDDGQVRFGSTEQYDPFDEAGAPADEPRTSRVGSIRLSPTNPPDVDPAYYARYGFAAGARSFTSVNLDPDLPTSAKAILDLFELQTEQRLDGVVLLDPVGLESLLEATDGNVPLSDELGDTLGFPDGLPVEGFAEYVLAGIYGTLGYARSDERNDALREIGDAAFGEIFDGRWGSQAMARAIVEAAGQRHLQVFTADEGTQAAFREVGATGELVAGDADLFALTANNVVGGKQDVHLGHEVDLDVQLTEVRRTDEGDLLALRDVALTATVDNPLPTSGLDPYIIGSCYLPDQLNRCFEGNPGENRTWFSAWASPMLQVSGFTSDDGTEPNSLNATYRDLRVVDHLHLTPAGSRASFGLEGEGRTPLRRDVDSVVYELLWWHQSKAIPDLLDVRVGPPEGWAIDRIEVIGGGSGRGMGVHGGGQPLEAEVTGGVAHLTGTVTADTRLRVHLVEAGGTGPAQAARALTP